MKDKKRNQMLKVIEKAELNFIIKIKIIQDMNNINISILKFNYTSN